MMSTHQAYYLDEMGKPVRPPIAAYSYEPRVRPWYTEGRANGAEWSSTILAWNPDCLISASIPMYDKFGAFRGVLTTAASITNIEKDLNVLVPDGATVYVLDVDSGRLVFTSKEGMSGEYDSSTSSCIQYYANASSNRAIRETADELQRQATFHRDGSATADGSPSGYEVPSVNPFLFNGYWVEVEKISKIGGLRLRSPWLFVVVQVACPVDFFFERRKDTDAELEVANTLGDCKLCPKNAVCSGGLALPIPKKGYYKFSNDSYVVYQCSLYNARYASLCEGGSAGESSCRDHSVGAFCSLCESNYFHFGDSCVECENDLVMSALASALVLLFLFTVAIVAWNLEHFSRYRFKIKSYIIEYKTKLEWVAMAARTFYFNYQVISRFTLLQQVTWPTPFLELLSVLDFVSLDVTTWFPPIECLEGYNSYATMYTWTIGPIVLYLLAILFEVAKVCIIKRNDRTKRRQSSFPRSSSFRRMPSNRAFNFRASTTASADLQELQKKILNVNHVTLQLINVFHTLICVFIFEMFDCTNFDVGNGKTSVLLFSDSSANCKTRAHHTAESYAISMVVIYVFFVPLFMAMHVRYTSDDRKARSSIFTDPYRREVKYFDIIDVYYRLIMTGFMLVVSKDNDIRSICCIYIAVAYLAFIAFKKPHVNASLNMVLMTGQFIVALSVCSGYIISNLENGDTAYAAIGWMLFVANTLGVIFIYFQGKSERLFQFLRKLQSFEDLSDFEFLHLYRDSSQITLSNAVLDCARECLKHIEVSEDDVQADRYWNYLTTTLLPLKDSNGTLIFEDDVRKGKSWVRAFLPSVELHLRDRFHNENLNLNVLKQGSLKVLGPKMIFWGRYYLLHVKLAKRKSTRIYYFESSEPAQNFIRVYAENGGADDRPSVLRRNRSILGRRDEDDDVDNISPLGTIVLRRSPKARVTSDISLEMLDRQDQQWQLYTEGEDRNEIRRWCDSLSQASGDVERSYNHRGTDGIHAFRNVVGKIFGGILADDEVVACFEEYHRERLRTRTNDERSSEGTRSGHSTSLFEAPNPMRQQEAGSVDGSVLADSGAPFPFPGRQSSPKGSLEMRVLRPREDEKEIQVPDEAKEVVERGEDYADEDGSPPDWTLSADRSLPSLMRTSSSDASVTGENDDARFRRTNSSEISVTGENDDAERRRASLWGLVDHPHRRESYKVAERHESSSAKALQPSEGGQGPSYAGWRTPKVFIDGVDIDEDDIDLLIHRLINKLRNGKIIPTMFAVVQSLGSLCHRRILVVQGETADKAIAEGGMTGLNVLNLKHSSNGSVCQNLSTHALALKNASLRPKFDAQVDVDVLPALMCAISRSVEDNFNKALAKVVQRLGVELLVGPMKEVKRAAEKVKKYSRTKGQGEWPYAKYITDVLRASFICATADDLFTTYNHFIESGDFEVVRLKNKLKEKQAPFNLHVNAIFHPSEVEDPIIIEVQFHLREVYKLQHRQHIAYKMKRAESVRVLL
jgi:hypothetical protein